MACQGACAALSLFVMKILFLGDIVGSAGRTAVLERVPRLRADWGLDFVVVNGENATNGMGLSAEHAKPLLEAGGRLSDAGRSRI